LGGGKKQTSTKKRLKGGKKKKIWVSRQFDFQGKENGTLLSLVRGLPEENAKKFSCKKKFLITGRETGGRGKSTEGKNTERGGRKKRAQQQQKGKGKEKRCTWQKEAG